MKRSLKKLLVLFLTLCLLAGCTNKKTANLKKGICKASSNGMNGEINVEVEVDSNSILKVEVKSQKETEGIADAAIVKIPKDIVKHQTLNLDAVSGATVTSKAIIEATKKCLISAGAKEDDFQKKVNKNPQGKISKTADVIIVGGGGAGLGAAVSASSNGAKVIVIEKTAILGGNTILAGGGYNAVDPKRQQKQEMSEAQRKAIEKILNKKPLNKLHEELINKVKKQLQEYDENNSKYLFDSIEFHTLQTYDGGDYSANLELVYEFCKKAVDMMNYLEENGVKWKDSTRTYLGALWPRSHEAQNYKSGKAFIDVFLKIIKEKKLDVEIITEVKANELTLKDGKVSGVLATDENNTEYEFKANKAVVLATGGFSANKEMRKKYDPSLLDSQPTTNSKAITGDGIIMAEKVGANLVGMNKIQSLPVANPVTGIVSDVVGASTAIFLNKEGKRFVDEANRRDVITKAVLAQTDGVYYAIVNEKNLMVDENGLNKNGVKVSDLVKRGSTIKADTLDELAKKLNMDPKVVKESIDKFQKAFDEKYDPEFGRVTFDKYVDLSAGGPYYATIRSAAVHHTMGGVEIDKENHVLNKEGKIIKGLYAAGEVTGGIHGDNRLGANAVPDALAFGFNAGINAALEK